MRPTSAGELEPGGAGHLEHRRDARVRVAAREHLELPRAARAGRGAGVGAATARTRPPPTRLAAALEHGEAAEDEALAGERRDRLARAGAARRRSRPGASSPRSTSATAADTCAVPDVEEELRAVPERPRRGGEQRHLDVEEGRRRDDAGVHERLTARDRRRARCRGGSPRCAGPASARGAALAVHLHACGRGARGAPGGAGRSAASSPSRDLAGEERAR